MICSEKKCKDYSICEKSLSLYYKGKLFSQDNTDNINKNYKDYTKYRYLFCKDLLNKNLKSDFLDNYCKSFEKSEDLISEWVHLSQEYKKLMY